MLAYEPDLGVPTRPDFLVERDGIEVVCEVKEFTTTRFDELMALAAGFFSLGKSGAEAGQEPGARGSANTETAGGLRMASRRRARQSAPSPR